MKKRKQTYATDEVTVTFDPNLCIHSAICLQSRPEVFDVSKKSWVRPENAPPTEVIDTVKKCPSGALQFSLPADE